MSKFKPYEDMEYEVQDEWHILHTVRKYRNGLLSATILVGASVEVDGVLYRVEKDVDVPMRKEE